MIESLEKVLAAALTVPGQPPRLADAMRAAVFPGGARIRPGLCMAVAASCGGEGAPLVLAAAAAVELLHCASLVHDDLPCFDNAIWRRGQPALHRQVGVPLALLAGDGLIIAAFALMARHAQEGPQATAISAELASAASRLVAGQSWEAEPRIDLSAYHAAKTGALFEAACVCGALAADADGEAWRDLGRCVGEAYQIADDLADVMEDSDRNLPNLASLQGPWSTTRRLTRLIARARAAMPGADCVRQAPLDGWFAGLTARLNG